MEKYSDIHGFEGLYKVSIYGNIFSCKKAIILKPQLQEVSKGKFYYFVNLYKNRKLFRLSVHRIVAKTFIPNPGNKPQVNHKDSDKLNNSIDNIEWCTHQENMDHAKSLKLFKSPKYNSGKTGKMIHNSKPVVISKDSEVLEFESMHMAAKYLDCYPANIKKVADGRQKKYKGWSIVYKAGIELGIAIEKTN